MTDRDETIQTIRNALRDRSGKAWSVTGGRGTAWGWIAISAPPRRHENGRMTMADTTELYELLGLEVPTRTQQQVQVMDSSDARREYIARAEGRKPEKIAEPYWD